MGKILLYYKYIFIRYPEQIVTWQKELCLSLGLTGRIIIAHEGINGTLGGTAESTALYIEAMQNHELFNGIDFKESEGDASKFPRLRVMIRNEIVHLGINPNELTTRDSGTHLSPEEAHQFIAKKPSDLVLLDCRNKCESDIGSFTGSIKPDTKYFREFPQYIDTNADQFKDKQVLMFCTGGIRCERASAYVKKNTGAKEVFQITGGIHRYTEQFPDGFFRGKNYVFDSRIATKVTDDILGYCALCNKAEDQYINCANARCNKHMICCIDCINKFNHSCSTECQRLTSHL